VPNQTNISLNTELLALFLLATRASVHPLFSHLAGAWLHEP